MSCLLIGNEDCPLKRSHTLVINPINNSNSEVKDENSRKKAGIISLLTGA